ncbi:MAG: helix-turn-helix domain-containing protein [Candidatus Acidiferrales bacterium]
MNLEPLLTPREAAEILRVTTGTLAVWRCTKRYPLTFFKIGRHIRYKKSDLDKFIAATAA